MRKKNLQPTEPRTLTPPPGWEIVSFADTVAELLATKRDVIEANIREAHRNALKHNTVKESA